MFIELTQNQAQTIFDILRTEHEAAIDDERDAELNSPDRVAETKAYEAEIESLVDLIQKPPQPWVVIRAAMQADIDSLRVGSVANVVDGAAALFYHGKLFTVADEYGTIYPDVPNGDELEDAVNELIYSAFLPSANIINHVPASQDPGWVVVVHDVDTDIIWDVYNHKPTEEDIHFAVIGFYDRCHWDLPPKSQGIYFRAEDMPDHCGITIGRLGQSLGLSLSR